MDKLKQNLSGYLLFAILGGFVAYMIWNNPSIDVDIQSYKTQINILQQRIDSMQYQNTYLKTEADSLTFRLEEYDEKIKKLNSRIYVIKRETEKKLMAIDTFGSSELQKFFAERYNQSKDSIN